MYETRKLVPLPHAHFTHRMLHHTGLALGLIALSVAMGMAGYVCFGKW